jgi:hypothetical protein
MTKITLAQLSSLSDRSEVVLQNWLARIPLATKFEKPKPGPVTEGRFTKDNAVEIILLSRMVKNGIPPAAAAAFIADLFKEIKAKRPHGWAVFFTKGNMPIDYMVTDKPPSAQFLSTIDGAVVINVAKLETDVDEFFAESSDD